LAPALYHLGQGLSGISEFKFLAESEFQRYFNRAVLLSALLLLYPLLRVVGVQRPEALGLSRDLKRWRHLFGGFTLALGVMALFGVAIVSAGVYYWKVPLPWGLLPRVFVSALAVAAIEEGLFRGLILGVVRQTAPPLTAVMWVSALFAILHFVKPEGAEVPDVRWYSGFALIPSVFSRFAEPQEILAGFSTLCVLGALLAHSTLRTRSLWLGIGLHAGLVFGKMGFNKLAKRSGEAMPWFGPDLTIGLGSVLVLLFLWLLTWYLFLRDRASPALGYHGA
jgi:uncharacterized protein